MMTGLRRGVFALGIVAIVATTFVSPVRDVGHDELAWLTTMPDDGLRTGYEPLWRRGPWMRLDARRLATWWSDIFAVCALTLLVTSRRRALPPSEAVA